MGDWRARGNRGSNYQRGGGGGNYDDRDGSGGGFQQFPNSGALFPTRQKRSDNSPDISGSITITDDVLDYVLREAEHGDEVKLELSGWQRMSRNNTNFTSLKVNIPYAVRMEEGNPTYREPDHRPVRRDERQLYSQPQRAMRKNSYAEQSGRGEPQKENRIYRTKEVTLRPGPKRQDDDDFARGDQMPDFLRDDNDPPFDR